MEMKNTSSQSLFKKDQWMVFGFITLGVIAMGIGIISIIAANWYAIPVFVKLGVDAAALLVAAAVTYRSYDSSPWFEMFLLFYMCLVLASIGLIVQTMQMDLTLLEDMVIWCLLTFPLIFFSERGGIPALWLSATLIFGSTWLTKHFNLFMIADKNFLAIYFAVAPFCCLMSLVTARYKLVARYSSLLLIWAGISGFITAMIMDIGTTLIDERLSSMKTVFMSGALSIAALLMILLDKTMTRIHKSLLAAMLINYCTMVYLTTLEIQHEVLAGVLTVTLAALTALYLGTHHRRRWFNFFVFIMGLRLFNLYLLKFYSLAMTGFGLIMTGLLIIGVTLFWHYFRKSITLWVEKLSHEK